MLTNDLKWKRMIWGYKMIVGIALSFFLPLLAADWGTIGYIKFDPSKKKQVLQDESNCEKELSTFCIGFRFLAAQEKQISHNNLTFFCISFSKMHMMKVINCLIKSQIQKSVSISNCSSNSLTTALHSLKELHNFFQVNIILMSNSLIHWVKPVDTSDSK